MNNRKSKYFNLLLLLLLITNIWFVISMQTLKIYFLGETINMDLFYDVLINVGCSMAVSIGLTITIYFKFLKRIPEENEKRINNLLNERLGHETANHNAVLAALNPNNTQLTDDHRELHRNIISIQNYLSNEKGKLDSLKGSLAGNEQQVLHAAQTIAAITDILLDIKLDNQRLIAENSKLRELLSQQQDKGKRPIFEYDIDR